ncbi:MAG TPA: chromate resistance protein ChrB domain-containing protein [Steroidobacteraceae bacterium]
MKPETDPWLLFVTNLPGRNATLRMRIWRALKSAGAGLLRDGVYVLPRSDNARRVFDEQRAEIKAGGGLAHILSLDADSPEQNAAMVALFDRTAEYQDAIARLAELRREFKKLSETEARQRLAAVSRDITATLALDFFRAESHKQVQSALADAESAFNTRFAADEPRAAHHKVRSHDRKTFRSRTWATRERLWIDRVASAWLIRRFIDPKAKFIWLKRVKDCPKRAVGFDFDGATFTHVDSKVTFEVLIASFDLESDPGLSKLASLVHQLDVGGLPVPEAAGFATIMAGARSLHQDDDALLQMMTPVLDGLYAGYSNCAAN